MILNIGCFLTLIGEELGSYESNEPFLVGKMMLVLTHGSQIGMLGRLGGCGHNWEQAVCELEIYSCGP